MAEEAAAESGGAVTERRSGPDRRRGRPREFDGTPVSVRLPAGLHDALSREALQRDEDLSDIIREALGYFVSRKTPPSKYAAQ